MTVLCPKISKIWQYTDVILPDINAVKSNNLKNKQLFSNFVRWNFGSYWANTPPFRNRCFFQSERQRGFVGSLAGVKCALNVFYCLLSRISWLLRIWLHLCFKKSKYVECYDRGRYGLSSFVILHCSTFNVRTSLQPLCGAIQPIEVAKSIAFLASDESSCITGETLFIDGGRHVRAPV